MGAELFILTERQRDKLRVCPVRAGTTAADSRVSSRRQTAESSSFYQSELFHHKLILTFKLPSSDPHSGHSQQPDL